MTHPRAGRLIKTSGGRVGEALQVFRRRPRVASTFSILAVSRPDAPFRQSPLNEMLMRSQSSAMRSKQAFRRPITSSHWPSTHVPIGPRRYGTPARSMTSTERETQALTLVPMPIGVRENSASSIVHLPSRRALPQPPECDLAHLFFIHLALVAT